MRVFLSILFIGLACTFSIAQNYRGEALPVAQRADPVEFSRLRFLTFAFGREGPMDAPLSTPPVMGREYFVEADVFGIESAANIRFELLGATGSTLQTLTMWKASDGATDGEFYGFVTVPRQPFRAVVTGTTKSSAAFRSVFGALLQPAANGPADQPILPPGIPADQAARIESLVDAYRQQLRSRAAQAAAEHPGGVITLAGAVVSVIAYEPLASAAGLPIGMRLRYSIRFPSRQTLTAVPEVFPVYPIAAWRGAVTMKPLTGTIAPAPQMLGAQTLQDVIVYKAGATYQSGVTYNFTMDLVPDFVFQGTQTGRFCIHEQKFTNRALWDALITSPNAVPYSISIADTETVANIPEFFSQRTFHESFSSGGAIDCGPVPNIRF
jgi:hypothetical protein